MIDFQSLLIRYISHVQAQEGSDFVASMESRDFTEEELRYMETIADEQWSRNHADTETFNNGIEEAARVLDRLADDFESRSERWTVTSSEAHSLTQGYRDAASRLRKRLVSPTDATTR